MLLLSLLLCHSITGVHLCAFLSVEVWYSDSSGELHPEVYLLELLLCTKTRVVSPLKLQVAKKASNPPSPFHKELFLWLAFQFSLCASAFKSQPTNKTPEPLRFHTSAKQTCTTEPCWTWIHIWKYFVFPALAEMLWFLCFLGHLLYIYTAGQ